MSNPIEQEIILQSDGNFYKRTVVTTLIQSQDQAVQRVKARPVFHVTDIPVAPNTHIASFTGSSKHYLFKEVPFFRFRGAVLESISDRPDTYALGINRLPFQTVNEDQIQTSSFNEGQGLRWDPSALGYRMFFMYTHKYIRPDERVVQEDAPFVFLYSPELKTSFIPNLPNVFDSGKICTGDNFTNVGDTTQELIAVNQHELENSNCNNDLRMTTDLEARYVRFDRHGNTLDIDEPDMPTNPKGNRFFIEPRLEPILEYTQWMINMNR